MKARRIARGFGLEFDWEGGEYIDIKFVGDEYPFDVINTSLRDGTFPEFTRENFRSLVTEYIRTCSETELWEYRMIRG